MERCPPRPASDASVHACAVACGLGSVFEEEGEGLWAHPASPGSGAHGLACSLLGWGQADPGARWRRGPRGLQNRVIICISYEILPEILWGGHFSISQRWRLRLPSSPKLHIGSHW